MAAEGKGMMFVLSSPSGTGKTTLTKKLTKNNKNFVISISHTTRKPRPSEVNGKDYYFVDKREFNFLIKGNNFFEYAKIFNNYYGTLKEPVLKLFNHNKSIAEELNLKLNKRPEELSKEMYYKITMKYEELLE